MTRPFFSYKANEQNLKTPSDNFTLMATYGLTAVGLDFTQGTFCSDITLTIIVSDGLVMTHKCFLLCSYNICMFLFVLLAAFKES